ncbi:hypothetical protein CHS0354_000459 [Potamilus streckersoni]|uniref:Large ribosomal subunit protein bL9m n=1 Tax=Potamilus streckersoni TaxID=2493646 RepID=A0AAE0W7X9_9BIVA|nr:hypothetical protein CHS0354_000459 [Potamilus streckersoni]
MPEVKKLYETTVIWDGASQDEFLTVQVEKLRDLLRSLGGEIKNEILIGRRKLAFPIKKKSIGYYVHIEFVMPITSLKELERQYRLNENILRFLTIVLDDSLLMMRERVQKYGSGIFVEKKVAEIENSKVMQVVLKKDIVNFGKAGDSIKVKDGYARNYLIPKGLAVRATEGHIRSIELEKKQKVFKIEVQRKKARELGEVLRSTEFSIGVKAGDGGRLFGSVTSFTISDMFKTKGYQIDRRDIVIPAQIKEVGKYEVKVNLFEDIDVDVIINVEGL